MEELKILTTEQLKKVIEEINKVLCERENEERKNAYQDLIGAMKKFQNTKFYNIDYCYFTIYCDNCDEETKIDFFESFDSIIEKLERGI